MNDIIKHALTLKASEAQALFTVEAEQSEVMDLKTRINNVANHLIRADKQTRRSWRRAMAEAAGCTYQNIRQASLGEQSSMDYIYLKRIAAWAGVNEKYMTEGHGPMLPQNSGDHPELGSADFTTEDAGGAPQARRVRRVDRPPPPEQVVSSEPIYSMTGLDAGFPSVPIVFDAGTASLMPAIPAGSLVTVQPCRPADVRTGDYVLVRPFDSGNGFFSVYTALPGGGFEVQDASGRCFNSNVHGTVLLGRVTRVIKDY